MIITRVEDDGDPNWSNYGPIWKVTTANGEEWFVEDRGDLVLVENEDSCYERCLPDGEWLKNDYDVDANQEVHMWWEPIENAALIATLDYLYLEAAYAGATTSVKGEQQ